MQVGLHPEERTEVTFPITSKVPRGKLAKSYGSLASGGNYSTELNLLAIIGVVMLR